jgi:hypothetical protein
MSTLIGTEPDQVPVNGMLGDMAFQNKVAVTIGTLTSNGTPSTDLPTYSAEFLTTATWTSTGWTGNNTTGWVNGASNVSPLSYPTAAVSATKYQIAYTVVRSAGSFTLAFGGQSVAGITATGAFGPTATTTGNLVITPTATFVGSIIVSIKSLTAVSTPVISLKDSTNTVRFEARVNTATGNTFLGLNSGRYNTTGGSNTASGVSALQNNTTGTSNTASGVNALLSNTTGYNNTASGVSALLSNTTGYQNTASGVSALFYNTTGYYNTAVGVSALFSNTTGTQNTASGVSALFSNTTGTQNTASGVSAGRYIADGATALTITNNSTYVGYNTRALANNNTNETVIGYNAIGIGSNTTTIGNSSTLATKVFGVQASGQVAPTIASATTIAPTTSIVFVSGNISIATITPPTGIATTGGQITLIPTGVWSTTTAGNIALVTTAVIGEALIMTYDAVTLKWYPSYIKPVFGSFYDTTTQTATLTTIAYLVGCASTLISNGVSISAGRITVAIAGVYNFQFSIQTANPTASIAETSFWVRYNGVDVVNSASTTGIPVKRGSINGQIILSLNQLFNMAAGDYIELWWHSDVAGVLLETLPATATPVTPQSPGVIYTISKL